MSVLKSYVEYNISLHPFPNLGTFSSVEPQKARRACTPPRLGLFRFLTAVVHHWRKNVKNVLLHICAVCRRLQIQSQLDSKAPHYNNSSSLIYCLLYVCWQKVASVIQLTIKTKPPFTHLRLLYMHISPGVFPNRNNLSQSKKSSFTFCQIVMRMKSLCSVCRQSGESLSAAISALAFHYSLYRFVPSWLQTPFHW